MVLAAGLLRGFGEGGLFFLPKKITMNQHWCVDVIKNHLFFHYQAQARLGAQSLTPRLCQKTKLVMWLLKDEGDTPIDWLGNIPELNLTENCWNHMKGKLETWSMSPAAQG